MVFMTIGVYSLNNASLDLYLMIIFGILGYLFIKLECEPAPLILAVVLGPLMEENLRRALLISRGDPTVFVTRPISLGFLIVTGVFLAIMLLPSVMAKRKEALAGEAS
jgi:TctA family transporter